jgi:hypothetical protein
MVILIQLEIVAFKRNLRDYIKSHCLKSSILKYYPALTLSMFRAVR